jgi:histidinol-phosphate aminotransferase
MKTSSQKELATAAVRNISPYVPGKPLSELEREYGITDSVKLASNENPLGPGPLALRAIQGAVSDIGLYPDGNGFDLKVALAKHHHCGIERVTLGNGSNDLLVLLPEAFLTLGSEAVYSQYCFAIFPIAVQATGATGKMAAAFADDCPMALGHDLEAMARLITERTRLIYIPNPNNPTGTWVQAAPLKRFIASLPATTLVIVDEAYSEYVSDPSYPNAAAWIDEFPNLVVTRTFSKAHGLAGLRVGYSVSSPEVADLLNRVRPPFNVNSIALAAATAALNDKEHLKRSAELNAAGMKQVRELLHALPLRIYPSIGNFVLVDCKRPAAPVYEAMLRQGVIVRPVGGYGLPNHLRITIGSREQNARMAGALAHALRTA